MKSWTTCILRVRRAITMIQSYKSYIEYDRIYYGARYTVCHLVVSLEWTYSVPVRWHAACEWDNGATCLHPITLTGVELFCLNDPLINRTSITSSKINTRRAVRQSGEQPWERLPSMVPHGVTEIFISPWNCAESARAGCRIVEERIRLVVVGVHY